VYVQTMNVISKNKKRLISKIDIYIK